MQRIRIGHRLRTAAATALACVAAVATVVVPTGPAMAAYAVLSGGGSTWSEVAVQQWASDVSQRFGLTINYDGAGSTKGRSGFREGYYHFGVTEIPYQRVKDGTADAEPVPENFLYMPIVAGGTSFMYNLKIGGRQVRDLRLSGETITKIFTGVITNWNDPQITKEYGSQLPNKRITVVVRSDGSGTSAQFSLYMSKHHSGLWNDYCRKAGRPTPCGLTSFYPIPSGMTQFKPASGSFGVSNYVAASYGDGAITYVEYAYARQKNLPVVKMANQAGYYVEPTANAVAVALQRAELNPDLTQKLDNVYANPDRRAYPLSSYSYMLVRTTETDKFKKEQGASLSTFANYFLCTGQQKAAPLGYSPLPINLVQAGFNVIKQVPGAVPANVDLKTCGNPTFDGKSNKNLLAENAPYPAECDKVGAARCGTTPNNNPTNSANPNGNPSNGTNNPNSNPNSNPSNGTNSNPNGTNNNPNSNPNNNPTSGPSAGPSQSTAPGAGLDPETGQPLGSTNNNQGTGDVFADSVEMSAMRDGGALNQFLYILFVALIVLAIVLPPVLAQAMGRKKSTE